MAPPSLYQLTCSNSSWSYVSACLMSDTDPRNPYPEVIPMLLGKNRAVLIGGTNTFNWEKWEAVCSQMTNKPNITFTRIPPLA